MKKEKDIVEFFNHYSEQMLPKDGKLFMEKLEQNINQLPVPSAFKEMDPEMSKEYARWLLAKLEKDYKRSKRDTIICCVFTSITVAAILLAISALGVLEINSMVTLGILAVVALVSIGLMYSLLPAHTRDLF